MVIMYSDSSFLNVFLFWGLKINWIPESGEVIVSQLYRACFHTVLLPVHVPKQDYLRKVETVSRQS